MGEFRAGNDDFGVRFQVARLLTDKSENFTAHARVTCYFQNSKGHMLLSIHT